MGLFLADVRPDEVLPFLLGAIMFMIPIVAILTAHQQKMAKIMRENASGVDRAAQDEATKRELDSLRQLVLQQTMAIDTLMKQQRELLERTSNESLEQRIGRQ